MPQSPKPPIMMVAPSGTSATAVSASGNTLFIGTRCEAALRRHSRAIIPTASAAPGRATRQTFFSSMSQIPHTSPVEQSECPRRHMVAEGRCKGVKKVMSTGTQNLVIASLALTALVIAAAPARAEDTLIVTVPFDFVAGSTQFAAGTYEVRSLENPGVMSIRTADGRRGMFVLTQNMGPVDDSTPPELVFNKYENLYRFASVVFDGGDARELPNTHAASEGRVAEVVAVRP